MGTADNLSPTWEGITDMNQISPLSHSHTGAWTINPRALHEVLHAPLYNTNSQTSAGSSNTLLPQLPENEVPPDSERHATTEEDETPNTLISSPSRPSSPPHNQLYDVARLTSLPSLLMGRQSSSSLARYSDLNLLQKD